MTSTIKDPQGLGSISVQTVKPKRSIKQRKRQPSKVDSYLAKVEQLNGLPPLNPFRSLRELGGYRYIDENNEYDVKAPLIHNRTIIDLATSAQVTKQALIRTEQGTFPSIPPKILEYYQGLGVPYATLVNGYEIFQRLTRQRNYLLFGRPLLVRRALKEAPHQHTFTVLRGLWHYPSRELSAQASLDDYAKYSYASPVGLPLNVTEIAKLLCLSQGSLTRWENHPKRQKSVPKHFQNALIDNGYRMKDLSAIAKHYANYRSHL